jgi:hypothetical protein
LHGPDETAEQKARKREALNAALEVNTVEANHPDARQGKFLNQAGGVFCSSVVKGF